MRVPGWARVAPDVRFDPDSRLPLVVTHKKTNIEMVLIPAGSFLRGLSKHDRDAWSKRHGPYRVRVRRPFYLGRYEVTRRQWNASEVRNPDRPIANVTSTEVSTFLAATGLRFPTMREWAREYRSVMGPPEAARYQGSSCTRGDP